MSALVFYAWIDPTRTGAYHVDAECRTLRRLRRVMRWKMTLGPDDGQRVAHRLGQRSGLRYWPCSVCSACAA